MEKRKEKKEQRKERERMQLAILEVGERNGEERERGTAERERGFGVIGEALVVIDLDSMVVAYLNVANEKG